MIRKWKTLNSKLIFNKPPWLRIREDNLLMPKGKVLESYYVLEYPDWVSIIAIDKDEKFVVVEQYRHGIGEVNIELSAGVVDPSDESPLYSAKRELLEETGYAGGHWTLWITNSANPGTHTNLTYCFLAEGVERVADQKLDDTEDMSIHLYSRAEMLELLQTKKMRQALHASALWKYMALK